MSLDPCPHRHFLVPFSSPLKNTSPYYNVNLLKIEKGNTVFDVADTEWIVIFTAPATLHNSGDDMDTAVCVDAVPCVAYMQRPRQTEQSNNFQETSGATGYMTAKWIRMTLNMTFSFPREK